MGGQVFLHNAHLPNTQDANPKSTWSDPLQETLITPSIDKLFFKQIAAFDSASALLHFLPLKRNPSSSPVITTGREDVALGTLNVTDYNEYKFKDPETVASYLAQRHHAIPVSLETTHGLIRLGCDPAPFIFVTGITDSFLHFDEQVGVPALADSQNFRRRVQHWNHSALHVGWLYEENAELVGSNRRRERVRQVKNLVLGKYGEQIVAFILEHKRQLAGVSAGYALRMRTVASVRVASLFQPHPGMEAGALPEWLIHRRIVPRLGKYAEAENPLVGWGCAVSQAIRLGAGPE